MMRLTPIQPSQVIRLSVRMDEMAKVNKSAMQAIHTTSQVACWVISLKAVPIATMADPATRVSISCEGKESAIVRAPACLAGGKAHPVARADELPPDRSPHQEPDVRERVDLGMVRFKVANHIILIWRGWQDVSNHGA